MKVTSDAIKRMKARQEEISSKKDDKFSKALENKVKSLDKTVEK